jgi:two-component system chemotaxis sensor kinase CheA
LKSWIAWVEDALESADARQPLPALPNLDPESAETPALASVSSAPSEGTPPEEPLSLNLEGDAELLGEFVGESHEHLQNVELGVLTLEENPTDADTLNSIFRAFHTFKGGSGFLNLRPINTGSPSIPRSPTSSSPAAIPSTSSSRPSKPD